MEFSMSDLERRARSEYARRQGGGGLFAAFAAMRAPAVGAVIAGAFLTVVAAVTVVGAGLAPATLLLLAALVWPRFIRGGTVAWIMRGRPTPTAARYTAVRRAGFAAICAAWWARFAQYVASHLAADGHGAAAVAFGIGGAAAAAAVLAGFRAYHRRHPAVDGGGPPGGGAEELQLM